VAPLCTRLAAWRETGGESTQTLRQVTILFLDVVGSTTLSQHLEPEEIHGVMDGALADVHSLQAQGGKVLPVPATIFGPSAPMTRAKTMLSVPCAAALLCWRLAAPRVEVRRLTATPLQFSRGIHTAACC